MCLTLRVIFGLGYIVGASVTYWTGLWQWGIRVTPVFGVVFLVLIIFAFEDPVRGQADQAHLRRTSYKQDILSLAKIPTYIYTTLGFTSVVFVTGSLSWWTPSCAEHAWGMINNLDVIPPSVKASISESFGILSCVGGLLGVVLGSILSRIWQRGYGPLKSNARADPLVCAFGSLAAVPTMWLALFTIGKSMVLGYFFVFISILLVVLNFAITTDIILYVTAPNHAIRGGSTSSTIAFSALQYALFVPNAVLVLGGVFYMQAANHVEKDRETNLVIMHDLNPPTILDYEEFGQRSGGRGVHRDNHPIIVP
uniref:Uncharacterized protein n=1 Tax=Ditylenchus dipsaci TaxID=166011 RepID=A0A915ES55_9BILA